MTETQWQIIEKRTVTRAYDFEGVEAVIEHPEKGRLYVEDGFGYEDRNCTTGGMVRWKHGMAIQVSPDDTLQSLDDEIEAAQEEALQEEDVSVMAIPSFIQDIRNDICEWSGKQVESVAKAAGLR